MGANLAGQHDLVELSAADALDRSFHGVLVVRGRRRAGQAGALDRVGIQQRHGRRHQLGESLLEAIEDGARVVVGLRRRAHREPCLASMSAQGDLRQHERRRRQRRPLGRGTARGGEGEAAHEHRARRARPRGVASGIVGERAPPELARVGGHAGKALLAAGLHQRGLAQPREHEPVAIGLLEAEVAVVRAPGGERRGGQVELGAERHGDRGDGRARASSRLGDGHADANRKALARLRRESKGVEGGRGPEGHR